MANRFWATFHSFWIAEALFLALISGSGCTKKPSPPPPPEVQVITVAQTNVPIFEQWIGTIDGFVNAQIRAQVTGYLLTRNYLEGNAVKKGDLLFQIDPRPFQAALNQVLAKMAQDKAQLGKTDLDVKRFTPLAKDQAISQQELDNAIQAKLAAQAQVNADEAAIETAQLNLEFTSIRSPVDGLAGIAQAQIGDLVSQSGAILTTVSTLNPIRVYFQVSEQSFLSFWRHRLSNSDTNSDLPLQLILSDGSTYPEPGRMYFVDRQVNPTTGTLQVAGLFPNTNSILRPGQYAQVRAQTQIKTNAILVPQRAVNELQGTYQIAVLTPTNSVRLQSVQVGRQIGSMWIIESGLKAGDRIIVEGLQRAKEGTVVIPKPFQSPTTFTPRQRTPALLGLCP